MLVWVRLKQVAHEAQTTIYLIKHGLLPEYLRQHLKSPGVRMVLAQVLEISDLGILKS
jgi:hypothetical protein